MLPSLSSPSPPPPLTHQREGDGAVLTIDVHKCHYISLCICAVSLFSFIIFFIMYATTASTHQQKADSSVGALSYRGEREEEEEEEEEEEGGGECM